MVEGGSQSRRQQIGRGQRLPDTVIDRYVNGARRLSATAIDASSSAIAGLRFFFSQRTVNEQVTLANERQVTEVLKFLAHCLPFIGKGIRRG